MNIKRSQRPDELLIILQLHDDFLSSRGVKQIKRSFNSISHSHMLFQFWQYIKVIVIGNKLYACEYKIPAKFKHYGWKNLETSSLIIQKLYKPTFSIGIMNQGRKITGGKYHRLRKTRLHERHVQEHIVILGETKKKTLRVRGGNQKIILLNANSANVSTGKEIKKAGIINVLETPQNKFMARQNRLTKGAIIETSIGKAKITNRPSQEGQINAVLVKE